LGFGFLSTDWDNGIWGFLGFGFLSTDWDNEIWGFLGFGFLSTRHHMNDDNQQ
jgi:hypothetical protein